MPKKPRVLIVDDDDHTRAGLSELLSRAGYECTAAGSFHEAVQILRARPPDLLITDIRLRDFNGLQLLFEAPPGLPAIVMTGYADPVLEDDSKRAGASYVTKPLDADTLLALVKERLQDVAKQNNEASRTP